jgi:hypothetical protein
MASIIIDVEAGIVDATSSVLAPKNNPTFTGQVNLGDGTTLIFEGATPNNYETTLQVTDPTADRTITLPNATGTVALTSDLSSYLTSSTAASTYLTQSNAATTYQSKDADLTAIAGLTGTSGFLKKTGANTWELDTSTYLSASTASSTYATKTEVTTADDLKVAKADVISGTVSITLVAGKGSATISGVASGIIVVASPQIDYAVATNTYNVGVITSSNTRVIHLKSSNSSDTSTVVVNYIGHK